MGQQQPDGEGPERPGRPPEPGPQPHLSTTGALAALGRALAADLARLWRRLRATTAALVARLRPADRLAAARRGFGRTLGTAAAAGAALRSRAGTARADRDRRADVAPPATGEVLNAGRRPQTTGRAAATPRLRPRRRRWRRLAAGIAGLAGLAITGMIALLVWALWGMNFEGIAEASTEPSVVIEAVDGEMFATKGPLKGPPVDRESVPDYLVAAVLATEDRRFHDHFGLDPVGIARAALTNLRSGRVVAGGSTITQQLARNLFLTQDRTLKRKLREAALALWLEARLDKDQILTRYLGTIYMGAGVNGMPAAARVYFDKELPELTLAEAAMLAGIIKAPSDLNPRTDLAAARERAEVVLNAMVETGAVDPAQAEAAKAFPAELHEGSVAARSGGWFADWVYQEAAELAGSFNGTLFVQTTLHPRVQALAEQAIAEVMDAEGAEKNAGQAALVAMLPDGAVLAVVGGRDYEESQFNRATEAMRQPGSTFKPFVYYAALEQGWSLRDGVRDEPVEIDGWTPENYSGRYRGQVTLATALASSLNAATVRLSQEVGIERVAAAARSLGIDSELPAAPSLALGTVEVTLMDLTGAYASIVEGRAPIEPWGIVNFGSDATDRYRLGPRTEAQPIPAAARNGLIEGLRLAVAEGTGKAAQLDGFAAGKTGTTQDHRDAWFVGFNGPFVAGVWVGNDDNAPMEKVTGGDLPAKIWRIFMTDLMAMVAEGDPILRPVGDWGGGSPASGEPQQAGTEQPSAGAAASQGTGQQKKAKGKKRRERALSCNVRACERAYRSFRRSDCTFQPYRGPRKRCAK